MTMPTEAEIEAAFHACAAMICNEQCTGDDPACACHMAVRAALEAAAKVRADAELTGTSEP